MSLWFLVNGAMFLGATGLLIKLHKSKKAYTSIWFVAMFVSGLGFGGLLADLFLFIYT